MPSDDIRLREALAPGKDCPSIEDLGLYEERKGDQSWRAGIQSHVAACAYCATELHLMQEFQSGEVSADEAAAVRTVTAQLDRRASEIFQRGRELGRPRGPWWKKLLGTRWLTPAAVALAGVLVIAGVGLQLRHGAAPALDSGGQGHDVMRSSALLLSAPVGDLREAPGEVAWQAVDGAAKYRVRIFEVDRTPLWQAETAETRVPLPADVRSRIVPAKTLLCEVIAVDAAGAKIADSEKVRFRVAPTIH